MSGVRCGGVGEPKEATADVQELVLKVKPSIEEKTGNTYEVFEAKQYATQVVAGTNYFVKVHVGGDEHVHVRIFRNLQGESSVHSVQAGMSEADPLVHF